jgi:hypothetical protein
MSSRHVELDFCILIDKVEALLLRYIKNRWLVYTKIIILLKSRVFQPVMHVACKRKLFPIA